MISSSNRSTTNSVPPVIEPRWNAVWSLAIGVAGLITAEFLPVSLLTPMAAELGITEGAAGQTISLTAGAAMVTSVFITAFTQRFDRRWVLLSFCVLQVVSNLLVASASLLMEQVLAPRFNFTPKNTDSGSKEGYDYGESGYQKDQTNVGYDERKGLFDIEIKGVAEPRTPYGKRTIAEDLNELTASFVQDKQAIERGLFDTKLVPQELTQVRMGKIIKDRYPDMEPGDQEAVRQHAVAAINIMQQAQKLAREDAEVGADAGAGEGRKSSDGQPKANTALLDGIRKLAMDVRELDVDWIDSINPFEQAYSIISKSMDNQSLRAMAEVISAKKQKIDLEEARELARRAVRFKQERGRLPDLKSADPWEQRMAQGIEVLKREAAKNSQENG